MTLFLVQVGNLIIVLITALDRMIMKNYILFMLFLLFSTSALATVEDRATGKSGVTTNITDTQNQQNTAAKVRTEFNDIWDSSVLQGELSTLVTPIVNTLITGVGGTSEYLYTPTDATCTTDMSTEFEAFLTAHGGILIQKAGTCIRLDDGGKSTNYVFESATNINWQCEIPNQCRARNTNSNNILQYYVPDGIALDSKTIVSAVVGTPTTAINKDDMLPYVTVASTAGYKVGDIGLLTDSVPLPNRLGSSKTITNVAWNGSACIVTTSTAHGYSDTHFVMIKGVIGTGQIDTLDGADGYGRTYNITSVTSTTFSLESMDNTTGSSTGSATVCSTGVYTSGGLSARTATWAAEGVKIAGVDTVLNRIYFAHRLAFEPLYVQQPVLYRYTEARKVDIRGIIFEASGNTSDLSINVSDAAIDIIGVPRVNIEEITCRDTWDSCVILRGTPFSKIQNISGSKMPNRGTDDPSGTPKTITAISVASQAVFTSTSHGFSSGTVVILNNLPTGYEPFEDKGCSVSDPNTNDYKCKDTYGNYFDSTGFPTFSGSATAGEAADVTGLGYLASINSGNLGTVINGIYPEEGRHGITTDGSALSWKATLSTTDSAVARFGSPTYNLYMNGKCTAGNGVCWDEHEEAYKITWRNLMCDAPMRGVNFGSYKGRCGQFRGDGSIIDNIIIVGGQKGLRFPPSDWFRDRQFTIGEVTCQDMWGLQTSAKTADSCVEAGNVESGSYTSYTNKAHFDIGKIKTQGVSQPLWVDKQVTVKIDTLDATDFDDAVDCGAGANLKISNMILDHADPQVSTGTWTHKLDWGVNGFNGVLVRSDATYGDCDVNIERISNTQGTGSNFTTSILDETDTASTKNYMIGSYIEHNPNSVTAARILEAGSTTFAEKTTTSSVFVKIPKLVAIDNATATLSSTAVDGGSTLVLTGQGISEGVEIDPNNNGGTREFRFRPDVFRFTPEDSTSVSTRVQFQTAVDTSILTGEASMGTFGSSVTRTHDVGSYTNQRDWRFVCPTHAYDAASTIDDAACVYIGGAATSGTNATFTRNHALWVDNGISRFDQGLYARNVLTTLNTGGAASVPTTNESMTFYINTGATALTHVTLPGASVTDGSPEYSACVLDADGIRFTAAAGDVIRFAATVSGAAGYIQSTTIGDCFTLRATDATNWLVTASVGAGIAVSP